MDVSTASHVADSPANLSQPFRHLEAGDIWDTPILDLTRYSLLDARLLTGHYQRLSQNRSNSLAASAAGSAHLGAAL